MIGSTGYGEEHYGSSGESITHVKNYQLLHIMSHREIVSGLMAYIRSHVETLPSFGLNFYISGGAKIVQTNEDEGWGPVIDGVTIFNQYDGKRSYINGNISSSTGAKTAYILSKGLLMDVPTEDGKADPYTNIATDYGPHSNHITLYNLPTWIRGPHD